MVLPFCSKIFFFFFVQKVKIVRYGKRLSGACNVKKELVDFLYALLQYAQYIYSYNDASFMIKLL